MFLPSAKFDAKISGHTMTAHSSPSACVADLPQHPMVHLLYFRVYEPCLFRQVRASYIKPGSYTHLIDCNWYPRILMNHHHSAVCTCCTFWKCSLMVSPIVQRHHWDCLCCPEYQDFHVSGASTYSSSGHGNMYLIAVVSCLLYIHEQVFKALDKGSTVSAVWCEIESPSS